MTEGFMKLLMLLKQNDGIDIKTWHGLQIQRD